MQLSVGNINYMEECSVKMHQRNERILESLAVELARTFISMVRILKEQSIIPDMKIQAFGYRSRSSDARRDGGS
jgi:hypothetical protein